MAPQDQIIGFKTGDIIARFNEAKKNAQPDQHWWTDYIQFEWNNVRPGKNNTRWLSIKYRNGVTDNFNRLNVIIFGEVHTGQIMPNKLEDVAELKAKNPESKVEQRQLKASLQFQKWSKQVQTQEDKVSLVIENGQPVLPSDEYLSKYFQVIEYIEYIIKTEIRERIERYTCIIVYMANNKGLKDSSETAQLIRKEIGHIIDGDTIIQETDYRSLKDKFPICIDELTKGFIKVHSTKCSAIIQEYISDKAPKNRGQKLPNPITRVTIPFDLKGKPLNLTILDKNKAFKCNGKLGFDMATINEEPITADNIHKLIVSRCTVDGIICLDSICFSQLGISLPVKASTIIVKQPSKRDNNVFNICTSIYGDEIDDDVEERPSGSKKEKEKEKESSKEVLSDDGISDTLLDELQD